MKTKKGLPIKKVCCQWFVIPILCLGKYDLADILFYVEKDDYAIVPFDSKKRLADITRVQEACIREINIPTQEIVDEILVQIATNNKKLW